MEANVILTQNEIPSPLVANYEFFLQNLNAFFSIIKHMTDIESPRKRILQKLHDVEYRTFSFAQIKTQAKACLSVLQDLHLMTKDQAVISSTKKFARLIQNIVQSWDTFFFSIAVVEKGSGKINTSNNIRLFYMLTKFDMAEFAKNLEKQKKRMELALLKTVMKLDVGSTENKLSAGNIFKLKNSKFEELLFSSNAACDNEGETVDGFLDDSFAYVPKPISDPKYYHPKKRRSNVSENASLDKEQCDYDNLLKKQNEPRSVGQVDDVECEAALRSIDNARAEMPLQSNCISYIPLDSIFGENEVLIESERPLPINSKACQFVSSATNLNGATCGPLTPVDKSYSFNATLNRGLKRKRDEPLCDVTNGLSLLAGHRGDWSSLKTASSLCYEGNVDCQNQTLKKVKLSREAENAIAYQNAVKNDSVEKNRFKDFKKLGRRLKAMKSRLVKDLRGGKRSNNVFPIMSLPREFR
eukprot:gene12707-3425_t